MSAFTNREILAAVLTKWAQPAIQSIASTKLSQLPMMANIESKLRSTGWVSPMWKLGDELSPLLGGVGGKIIEPMLAGYLSNIPDEALPELAHSIVDNAIKNGGLSLMEDNVVFEREDLEELKMLLKHNLPIEAKPRYEVVSESKVSNNKIQEL